MDKLAKILQSFIRHNSELMENSDVDFIDESLKLIDRGPEAIRLVDMEKLLTLISVDRDDLEEVYLISRGIGDGMGLSFDDKQKRIIRDIVGSLRGKKVKITDSYATNRQNIDLANFYLKMVNAGDVVNIDTDFLNKLFEEEGVRHTDAYDIIRDLITHNDEVINTNEEEKEQHYVELFKRYGYDWNVINEDNKKLIFDVDDTVKVEHNLELLSRYQDITTESPAFTTMVVQPYEIVNKVLDIANDKKIDISDLIKHPSFFNENNILMILDNMELMNSIAVDIGFAFHMNASLFMMSTDVLRYNLQMFKLYHLPLDVNYKKLNSTSLTGLSTLNMVRVMDMFIECGLYDYIKQNRSKLKTADPLLFYKCTYANKMGLSYMRTVDGGKLWIANAFLDSLDITRDNCLEKIGVYKPHFEKQDEMDKVIERNRFMNIRSEVMNSIYIKALDNYADMDVAYGIDGIIISRFKVLNILGTLLANGLPNDSETVLYALSYGKIMTEAEYKHLEAIVNGIGDVRS